MNRPRHPSTTASPGTAMSNALQPLRNVLPIAHPAPVSMITTSTDPYYRDLVIALVEHDQTPSSSRFSHTVVMNLHHLAIERLGEDHFRLIPNAFGNRLIDDTVTGAWELWGDREGNAFISFENEVDATMFRMALS